MKNPIKYVNMLYYVVEDFSKKYLIDIYQFNFKLKSKYKQINNLISFTEFSIYAPDMFLFTMLIAFSILL